MRSQWAEPTEIAFILRALTEQNRLACKVSLVTGLRINDVLAIPTAKWKKRRFTIREEKTGKAKNICLPKEIYEQGIAIAGQHYVFEHRLNGREHRTRQAVFKDLRRACGLLRIKENVTPHSMRKAYAVAYFNECGNLKKVQKLLNHSDEAVTLIYAMADRIRKR
ncbi:MAG: tyrosine-type recombinase/integrase [Clostridiales bacterium]|nr:tyrosine-type recombinase/integrase [Candidatus Equinaster intestinalis]